MKADRIGTTPRDQLRWAIGIVERRLPRSEGDWLNLRDEIQLFARVALPIPPGAPYTTLGEFLRDILKTFNFMIDGTVQRWGIRNLPRPHAHSWLWNKKRGRFDKQESPLNETFKGSAVSRLGDLLGNYGHLLMLCSAPAKMRPGRKPKDAPKDKVGETCGTLFVATKDTQLYCSSKCSSRVVKRKKRQKPKKKKARKR